VAPHLDPIDGERKAPGSKALGGLVDLPYHPIVDRGRLVGLWDWDGVKGKLVWKLLGKAPALEKAVAKEGEALSAYVTKQLGDVRSFSLDSPERRGERIDALAKTKW
jgi:hypothetical protein